MAQQQASVAQSAGLNGTNASRDLAKELTSDQEWTAPAIQSASRVMRAIGVRFTWRLGPSVGLAGQQRGLTSVGIAGLGIDSLRGVAPEVCGVFDQLLDLLRRSLRSSVDDRCIFIDRIHGICVV